MPSFIAWCIKIPLRRKHSLFSTALGWNKLPHFLVLYLDATRLSAQRTQVNTSPGMITDLNDENGYGDNFKIAFAIL
jgi:hypothetical protein